MPTIFKTIVKELWWILWTKIIIKGLNLVYMWKWEVSFFRMLDCLFARSQLNIEKKEKKKEREQDETVVTTTVASCSPFYCSIWLIWSSLLCVPKNKALISFSFFFFFGYNYAFSYLVLGNHLLFQLFFSSFKLLANQD